MSRSLGRTLALMLVVSALVGAVCAGCAGGASSSGSTRPSSGSTGPSSGSTGPSSGSTGPQALGAFACTSPSAAAAGSTSAYDRFTLRLRPVLFLGLRPGRQSTEPGLTRCLTAAQYLPANTPRAATQLPDGEPAAVFNGAQSLAVRSSPMLSITHTGALTVEAWIKPSTLRFHRVEGSGYVEWLGKGRPGAFEYALRIYSQHNTEDRANRISGYAFDPRGGEGSGSYFQDPVRAGHWIMVAVEYDAHSAASPQGWVEIFKNGQARQRTSLGQFDVVPRAGHAPFSIASLNGDSYFQGSIAKVAVFDRLLPEAALRAQYSRMAG